MEFPFSYLPARVRRLPKYDFVLLTLRNKKEAWLYGFPLFPCRDSLPDKTGKNREEKGKKEQKKYRKCACKP